MKKIAITITIIIITVLSTTTGTVYAQIFKNDETVAGKDNEIHSYIGNNSEEITNAGGLFRADNDDYARPEVGGAIGETPIGDGLSILILCNMFYGAIKFFRERRNKH